MTALQESLDQSKDHVQVLLQVKAGLASELLACREKLTLVEHACESHVQAWTRLKKKHAALNQYVQILMHTHARELDQCIALHLAQPRLGREKVSCDQDDEDNEVDEDEAEADNDRLQQKIDILLSSLSSDVYR
jgi:hypothetical protein